MSIPLLPKLNPENKIAITKRGVWQSESQNTLGNLVVDLKVAANAESDITSIPDLWARPSMYEMVLFDENHHLHQKYLNEWRGLLAIMAFREMHGFNAIERIELLVPEVDKISDDMPRFLKVVAMLLPDSYKKYKDSTIKKDGYYKIQLLTCNKKAFAILWPSILLFPAINPVKGMMKVPWWSFDGIGDPICELNDQEKSLLYQWLDDVKNGLDDNAGKLIQLLADFQNDLNVGEKADNYGVGNGINITGYCNLIDKPIKCSISGDQFLKNSNVMLVDRRNRGAKKLLVMTPDIGEKWNMSLNDIVVAGTCNMQTALPLGGKLFKTDRLNNEDLTPYNAELIMGEDFFTDKIYLISQESNLFPNAKEKKTISYCGQIRNVLLPIKKELLNYLEPDDIIKNFNISVVNDIDIKVELSLPLSGFTDAGKTLVVSKIYHGNQTGEEINQEIIGMDYGVPLITIWPNFIPNNEKNWQAYYSYYDDLAFKTFMAEPLWDENECEVRKTKYSAGYNAALVKGKSFPEGYVCKIALDTVQGEKEYEVGLILLQKPTKLPNTNNNPCKIGVDFGTTNSLAYMHMTSTEEIELVRFQNRLYKVTEYEDSEDAKGHLRRHFFSVYEQPNGDAVSIRTLFNPNNESTFNGDLEQPVFPGVAYFLDSIDNIFSDQCVPNLQQGKEMKWDSVNGREYMKYFLLNIGLLCMAEAVVKGASEISWYYSYPKVFNTSEKNDLASIWDRMINVFKTICPIIDNETGNKTESIAMAEFFKNEMKGTFNRGIVCLDIGGGSTDIAIWQGLNSDKPKGQCSLRFAGNDILNKQLYRNRKVLLKFCNNDEEFNDTIREIVNKTNEKDFNMGLEALLKYYEKMLFNSLVTKGSDKEIKIFIRNIAFALGGIFYYVGMLLGQLNKNSEIKLVDLPHCYVGGNGSKLLDWVSNGNYKGVALFKDIYANCLILGLLNINKPSECRSTKFEIKQSSNPKEEVAYGLVCNTSIKAVDDNSESVFDDIFSDLLDAENSKNGEESILAGEKCYVEKENGETEPVIMLSPECINMGLEIDGDMPMFNAYVKMFNAQVIKQGYNDFRVELLDYDFEDIRDHVNEYLAEQKTETKEEIILEPPFIIMLKKSLECLSKKD